MHTKNRKLIDEKSLRMKEAGAEKTMAIFEQARVDGTLVIHPRGELKIPYPTYKPNPDR